MFVDSDPEIVVRTMVLGGDMVAAETNAVGTLANGNHYDNRYAWIIEIRELWHDSDSRRL